MSCKFKIKLTPDVLKDILRLGGMDVAIKWRQVLLDAKYYGVFPEEEFPLLLKICSDAINAPDGSVLGQQFSEFEMQESDNNQPLLDEHYDFDESSLAK